MAFGLSGSLSACFMYIFALLCVSTEWQIKMLACFRRFWGNKTLRKWEHWLWGRKIRVLTDNNSLFGEFQAKNLGSSSNELLELFRK